MKCRLCSTIVIALAWACLSNANEGAFAMPEEAAALESRQSLDGSWLFHSAAPGLSEMPLAPLDAPGPEWRSVNVPASFSEIYPDDPRFEGAGWFRKTFTVPSEWKERRVVVRFEAVNHAARVWLNGRLLGDHQDTGLPFEFPIQEGLSFGNENRLDVWADSTRRDDRMPNGILTPEKVAAGGGGVGLAWHPPGGIVREVDVRATDFLRIEALRVNGKPDKPDCSLGVNVRVRNDRSAAATAHVRFQLLDHSGHPFMRFERAPFTVASGATATVTGEEPVGAEAWSLEKPVLYWLVAELLVDGQVVHSRRVRFGFRSINARDGRLVLNGQPVFLTGFNRHDDSPTRWNCPDPVTARADLEHIRRLGGNFVRLCHYPNHPLVLDLCDEIGLMAMEELPLFWWRGKADGEAVCQALLAEARRHLKAFIERDINHPSVIMWSVGNEWQTQRPGVLEGAAELINLAKTLDPSRLALHVSDHWRQEYGAKDRFDADDVIALTGYPNPPASDWWIEGIERLRGQYPGKPVLLAELGDFDAAKQPNAYKAASEAVRKRGTCGLVVWSWADYVGSREMGAAPGTFGVVTRDRQPKQDSLEAIKRIFAEVHDLETK